MSAQQSRSNPLMNVLRRCNLKKYFHILYKNSIKTPEDILVYDGEEPILEELTDNIVTYGDIRVIINTIDQMKQESQCISNVSIAHHESTPIKHEPVSKPIKPNVIELLSDSDDDDIIKKESIAENFPATSNEIIHGNDNILSNNNAIRINQDAYNYRNPMEHENTNSMQSINNLQITQLPQQLSTQYSDMSVTHHPTSFNRPQISDINDSSIEILTHSENSDENGTNDHDSVSNNNKQTNNSKSSKRLSKRKKNVCNQCKNSFPTATDLDNHRMKCGKYKYPTNRAKSKSESDIDASSDDFSIDNDTCDDSEDIHNESICGSDYNSDYSSDYSQNIISKNRHKRRNKTIRKRTRSTKISKKLEAFNKRMANPNEFYYRNNSTGIAAEDQIQKQMMVPQKSGKWDSEEEGKFLKLAFQIGVNVHWGSFSINIERRVGYQCSNFWRTLMYQEKIKDCCYYKDGNKYRFKWENRNTHQELINAKRFSWSEKKDGIWVKHPKHSVDFDALERKYENQLRKKYKQWLNSKAMSKNKRRKRKRDTNDECGNEQPVLKKAKKKKCDND